MREIRVLEEIHKTKKMDPDWGPRRPPSPGGWIHEMKKPAASYSRTGESRTTLGDGALDFRVRNGNGYDSSSMATGKKAASLELKRTATHERRKIRFK